MPTVVDSKEKPLTAPEIITLFASELNNTGYPLPHVLAAVARELELPNTDQVQIGNTVFIGHRGKGKHKNVMEGRALNVDTAQNFLRAGLKYLAYLQKRKVKYYRTDFQPQEYVSAFKFWHNKTRDTDTEIDVVQLDTGGYRAFVLIGEQPLTEFWRM